VENALTIEMGNHQSNVIHSKCTGRKQL